jgi:hypothetical protein
LKVQPAGILIVAPPPISCDVAADDEDREVDGASEVLFGAAAQPHMAIVKTQAIERMNKFSLL